MSQLKTTKALVKSILENDRQARNSDSYLYLKILKKISDERGTDFQNISVVDFLVNMDGLGVPPFESVRRSRQKVQAEFPALAADEIVSMFRAELEEEYESFAVTNGVVSNGN